MMAGLGALCRRPLAVALNNPVAITGQLLLPVLWVLVVGPALARAFGGFSHVDYFTYIAVGQIVFIIPFSAMFAGLVVIQDRYAGILRELLVAPIRRSVIPLANVATYGLAELLAYRITQPQIFGTLIPAIGATPYALCGAIYPLATLPTGVKQFAYALPWTHAVAILRYGLMGGPASGLRAIWHLQSNIEMALLSIGVLAAFATLTVGLALRAFKLATLA